MNQIRLNELVIFTRSNSYIKGTLIHFKVLGRCTSRSLLFPCTQSKPPLALQLFFRICSFLLLPHAGRSVSITVKNITTAVACTWPELCVLTNDTRRGVAAVPSKMHPQDLVASPAPGVAVPLHTFQVMQPPTMKRNCFSSTVSSNTSPKLWVCTPPFLYS